LELPEAWIDCPLHEMADVFLGKTPKKTQYRSEGNYKVIKFRDLSSGVVQFSNSKDGFVVEDEDVLSTLKEVKKYDVLITSAAHSGENIGKKTAFVEELPKAYKKIFFTGELLNIRASFDGSLSKWLYFYFMSEEGFKQIQKAVYGVHLTSGRAQNMRAVLAPSRQLANTVAKLEKLMAKVDQCKVRLEKIPSILKSFRQSVLAAACSGELTKDWRGKNPDAETGPELIKRVQAVIKKQYLRECADAFEKDKKKPKKPRLLDLEKIYPNEDVSTWGKLLMDYAFLPNNLFDGPFGSNLKTSDYTNNGVRVIRLENVGFLDFIDEKKTFISEKKHKDLIRHTVKEGDIIFASFVSDNVRTVVLPKIDKAIAKADCFCLRPIDILINRKYLIFILSSPQFYSKVAEIIHGATRPRINTKQLKNMYIPLAPIKEQQEIVRRVESLFKIADQVESRYKKAKSHVEKLTQSILAKAFRGELVLQDPNDEPASELLERIKAEKKKVEFDKKNRRKSTKPRKSVTKVSQLKKRKAS